MAAINGTDTTWRYLSELWKYNVLLEGKLEDEDSLDAQEENSSVSFQ